MVLISEGSGRETSQQAGVTVLRCGSMYLWRTAGAVRFHWLCQCWGNFVNSALAQSLLTIRPRCSVLYLERLMTSEILGSTTLLSRPRASANACALRWKHQVVLQQRDSAPQRSDDDGRADSVLAEPCHRWPLAVFGRSVQRLGSPIGRGAAR